MIPRVTPLMWLQMLLCGALLGLFAAALRAAAPRFFEPLPEPLPGEIPSPLDLPPGCRFSGRCPMVQPDCQTRDPQLGRHGEGRAVACLHPLGAA